MFHLIHHLIQHVGLEKTVNFFKNDANQWDNIILKDLTDLTSKNSSLF
jgi:hypothetical protein